LNKFKSTMEELKSALNTKMLIYIFILLLSVYVNLPSDMRAWSMVRTSAW